MRPKKKAKRVDRRVSCKDLGTGDCQGWLYKKRDKGGFMASHWAKRWCVIKEYNMYFYCDQEDLKAEGVLHLPAFQVSPATGVKTQKFAFKVHNLGTSFIFASERQDDMKNWMNMLGLAAINYDPPKVIKQGEHSASKDAVDSPAPLSRSVGDLTRLMDNIHKEQLTFDGKDKRKQRTSAILPTDGAPVETPVESIETLKRKHSLMRMLKTVQKRGQHLEERVSNLERELEALKKKEMLIPK